MEIISDIESLKRLQPDWDLLGAEFASPLMQFNWFYSAAVCLHNASDLRVIVLRSNEKVSAIAPLALSRANPGWLEIIGANVLHEPSGLLYDSPESLHRLLSAVLNTGKPVVLSRIQDDSLTLKEINDLSLTRAISVTRPGSKSHFVSTDLPKEEFIQILSKKRVREFRYKRNKGDRLGPISSVVYTPTSDNFDELFDDAVSVEARSWKQDNGSSLQKNQVLREFFRTYLRGNIDDKSLRFFFINTPDQSIAMRLCVAKSNVLWCLKIGYDAHWKSISPGMLIVTDCINYCLDNELNSQEFLGSAEDWQHAWPVKTHNYSTVILFPMTIKGLLGFSQSVLSYLKSRLK